MRWCPALRMPLKKRPSLKCRCGWPTSRTSLKQVQQTLEKLDRSKSDFIAVAAHELKTPLTLIEGYTAMLREMREQNRAAASRLSC
jgi:signal transduction histidine kinase